MALIQAEIAQNANPPDEASFGRSRSAPAWMRSVLRVVKALGPKHAAQFQALTVDPATKRTLSFRQCEEIIAERSGISPGTLRLMLRSDIGFDILAAFVSEPGQPDPDWLLECRYHYQSVRLTAEIAEAKARLKQERLLRKGTVPRRT